MTDWKNVEIYKNQIQYNLGRAVLIKCLPTANTQATVFGIRQS